MDGLNPVSEWEPPALSQTSWEDMLNDLLQEPDTVAVGAPVIRKGDEETALLGLVEGGFEDFIDLGDALDSGALGVAVDQFDPSCLYSTFINEECVSLPGLSSEVSTPAGGDLSGSDVANVLEERQEGGVSSPGSCSRVEPGCAKSSNSGDEAGNGSSRTDSPILTSCSGEGAASPDAGYDSSDVGAMGRSCDNFAEESERHGDKSSGDVDEDAKRQMRLMRNRESATQSRLRKKSYVKELEAKCRAMESQMSMLQQTVAFTSAQNGALREELAHYRCLKGNGSKSGAMEPAALPSDSLPSESPSRRTTPYLSAKLELVAFLCLVLLLTLLQVLPQKPATSGGRTPNKVRSDRRHVSSAAPSTERFNEAARELRRHQSSSNRRKAFALSKDQSWLGSFKSVKFLATLKPVPKLGDRVVRSAKSTEDPKRASRRSQYSFFRSSRGLQSSFWANRYDRSMYIIT